MVVLKKTAAKPKKPGNSTKVSGDPESMTEESKFDHVLALLRIIKQSGLDYVQLKEELANIDIELAEDPTMANISELNVTYAVAQSHFSRVSAIEMLAIDNSSRWDQIENAMGGFIDDRRSRIFLLPEVVDMKTRQQDAYVRVEMLKDYKRAEKIAQGASEAKSFLNMVKIKKKDLQSIVTNISRQVKVLSLDFEINRN